MALLFVYLGCHGILSGRIPNRCCHGNVYGRRTDSSCLQRGNFLQKYQFKHFCIKIHFVLQRNKGISSRIFHFDKNSYFVTPAWCMYNMFIIHVLHNGKLYEMNLGWFLHSLLNQKI